MSKTETVSVVIINFNGERWIPQTLKSCEEQTYSRIEYILVDDCSTDSSFDLFQEFSSRHQNSKVLSTPRNLGASGARNLGLREASGDFIAFLDSDDLFFPDTIQCYLDDFRRLSAFRNDLGMIMTDAWLVSEHGEIRGRYLPSKYWGRTIFDTVPNWTLPSAWFVKRSSAVDFCEAYRVGEGGFYVSRMLDHGSVALVGRPGIRYRVRMRSASNEQGAEEVRTLVAAKKTIENKSWNNPVLPSDVPVPSWQAILAWTQGRSAKAAFVNRRYFSAIWHGLLAAAADIPRFCKRAWRTIVQSRSSSHT